ncbi:MAG: tRNA pseudouridine(13) synthase TruD [Chloroflexi bacterium]|nr:MAG: tRNA pseudouridine(13) synthase TruD [Chloroflexota bacterium]
MEEIPRYLPSGQGQHVFVTIEKRGIPTYVAMRNFARALNINSRDVGCAGLKDAHAVTRQTLSLNLVNPDDVRALELPNIKILSVERHHNKLKTGHLAGNRFVIRVRDVNQSALPVAQAVIERLTQHGVPNFFGQQRFGYRHNTDKLGEALVRNDPVRFVAEYLGEPQPHEARHIFAARKLVDERRWEEALEAWPNELPDEKQAIAAILAANGELSAVFQPVNKKMKSLFVSAFQSRLFNALLAQRMEMDLLGVLQTGDVAYLHGKGAAFLVTDPAAEQPRADSFEISPSGPLFGPKTLRAQGEPGRREDAVLAASGLAAEDFTVAGLKIRGARRPYRFQIKQPNIWWDDGLMVSFELQPGAYATTVMAEIMKPDR